MIWYGVCVSLLIYEIDVSSFLIYVYILHVSLLFISFIFAAWGTLIKSNICLLIDVPFQLPCVWFPVEQQATIFCMLPMFLKLERESVSCARPVYFFWDALASGSSISGKVRWKGFIQFRFRQSHIDNVAIVLLFW